MIVKQGGNDHWRGRSSASAEGAHGETDQRLEHSSRQHVFVSLLLPFLSRALALLSLMTVIVIVIVIIIIILLLGGYIRGNQGIAWGIVGWGALMMLCVRGCVVIAGVELLVFDLCCKFNKMI